MTRLFKTVACKLSYVVLLGIAVLAGCASFDPSEVRSRTEGKSILVASDLGSALNLLWIGTTVFNNESGEHSAKDLRLDQAALSTALWALDSDKRYRSVGAAENMSRTTSGFPKNLKANADYLLLIERGTSQDIVFRTNQAMRGIGVLQRSILGANARAVVFAVLQGELFDLRTGESLGKRTYTEFMDTPDLLESGPKIPVSSLAPTLESATTRTKGAVVNLVRVLGL